MVRRCCRRRNRCWQHTQFCCCIKQPVLLVIALATELSSINFLYTVRIGALVLNVCDATWFKKESAFLVLLKPASANCKSIVQSLSGCSWSQISPKRRQIKSRSLSSKIYDRTTLSFWNLWSMSYIEFHRVELSKIMLSAEGKLLLPERIWSSCKSSNRSTRSGVVLIFRANFLTVLITSRNTLLSSWPLAC